MKIKDQLMSPTIQNRKVKYDYSINKSIEAGLVLNGSEIKSIRAGMANLRGSYVAIENNEAWVIGADITRYEQADITTPKEVRPIKLLLHKKELFDAIDWQKERGHALVIEDLHFTNGRAKAILCFATGKKLYDKRQALAEKDIERDIERDLER